jgi:magnesium-transporting ATPase (P-type)
MRAWHDPVAAILQRQSAIDHLATDAAQGLNTAEARRRLAEHGPNELREQGLKRTWQILWEQLIATMAVVLIIAAILSAALEDKYALAILTIVILNAPLVSDKKTRRNKPWPLRRLSVQAWTARASGFSVTSDREAKNADFQSRSPRGFLSVYYSNRPETQNGNTS